MRRLLAVILFFVTSFALFSAERDSSSFVHRIGADLRPSVIMQNNEFFSGYNRFGRRMLASGSAHARYSFMFPADSPLGRMYPSAYQGVGLSSYTFFNSQEIGNPVAVYVFQGADIASFPYSLSLGYEWNFGVSFGWRPYEPAGEGGIGGNPNNLVVGTKVNAYINGALMLSWRPLLGWTFSVGPDYTHFSNGDTTFPNSGVNTVGLRFGAVRSFGGVMEDERKPMLLWDRLGCGLSERIAMDVVAAGAWNQENVSYKDKEYIPEGKFAIFAVHVNPLYKLAGFLRVGPSLDIQYNEGVNIQNHIAGVNPLTGQIRFYRPPLSEQLAAGLSLRAELEMPIFSVNLGVGHNFIYRGEEQGGVYGLVSLKTFVSNDLFLNVGLKVNYTEASNNLLLGLGWRFGQ